MKRIITITASILLFALQLSAQYKVVESSSRKMPDWVNSVTRDYLNVTATGSDIEEAKAAVLAAVKQQIAQSIATRIVAESNLSTSAVQTSDTFEKKQTLEKTIQSRTAKLPFIGEISLSKAADFYWEKRYYRSTGKYEYFYAVKYPFSEFEMKKLVMDYREHDRELNARLAEYEAGLGNITSIEDIERMLEQIRVFNSEFDQMDPRYGQVQSLANRYRDLYDHISIDYYQEKKGVVAVTMTLAGNPLSTTQRPIIKSNCATKISTSYEGNVLVIRYSDENCYEVDDNYLDLRLRAGNKYITERIFIRNTVNISLTGIVSDAETGEPVPYAKITLIPGGKTATTGHNGMYAYNDLQPGTYSVQAMKKGYSTAEISTTIQNGQVSRADILLKSDGTALHIDVPANPVAPQQPHSQQPQQTMPATSGKDPLNTVRSGLSAYFRFNGNTRSEISAIQGNPINSPQYSIDSKDGTQSISFSSLDESQLIFPKLMLSTPLKNYTISFWIKGVSDGHILSGAENTSWYRSNLPLLQVVNGKFMITDGSDIAFSHPELDYNWHFIAIVSSVNNNGDAIFRLYIDGVLVDSGSTGINRSTAAVKLLLGGKSISGYGVNAIDMYIDNLRIYGAKALSDTEIAEIYMSEQ